MFRSQSGFSFVEAMVVVALGLILVGAAIPILNVPLGDG